MERTQTPEKSEENLSNKPLNQAGYAQCLFILIQSMLFPELGAGGAMIAALCAMVPWMVMYAKKMPARLFGMVMASLLLTPFYSMLCLFVLKVIGVGV